MSLQKLLVVDDDKLICWALQREFVSFNLVTRVVDTGADALAELRTDSYDLVFLDIHLPDGNGIDLMAEIAQISPKSKIVVMSGDASEANRQRAFSGGAVQFLEKPFDLSEIHSIVRSASAKFPRRRRHPRYVCRVPVRISIAEPLPEEAHLDLRYLWATTANVGRGGLQIHSEYPLRVGQKIRASIAGASAPFLKLVPPDTRAEVVWVAPAGHGVTAGVTFLS